MFWPFRKSAESLASKLRVSTTNAISEHKTEEEKKLEEKIVRFFESDILPDIQRRSDAGAFSLEKEIGQYYSISDQYSYRYAENEKKEAEAKAFAQAFSRWLKGKGFKVKLFETPLYAHDGPGFMSVFRRFVGYAIILRIKW